ncbi:hypothetical protein J6590_054702 [Homalodisca vitripennis]|nr:hypothetical protein J6590_054702 [Homalodisca vitripennis]
MLTRHQYATHSGHTAQCRSVTHRSPVTHEPPLRTLTQWSRRFPNLTPRNAPQLRCILSTGNAERDVHTWFLSQDVIPMECSATGNGQGTLFALRTSMELFFFLLKS